MTFKLHHRLAEDCFTLGKFPLSHLLLLDDANYPWCILVPDRADVSEIYQLNKTDQEQLNRESVELGRLMMQEFNGDKLNTGAIGNMVPQLHIHHIVRYKNDASWPKPVWGNLPPSSYTQSETDQIIKRILKLPFTNFTPT